MGALNKSLILTFESSLDIARCEDDAMSISDAAGAETLKRDCFKLLNFRIIYNEDHVEIVVSVLFDSYFSRFHILSLKQLGLNFIIVVTFLLNET